MSDRKSEAEIPALIDDPIELAEKEASNALEQFDWGMEEVGRWISAGYPALRLSTLLTLHRKAMEGIDQYAGNFRPASVAIKGSTHNPVAGDDVPRYVEEMIEYVDENWVSRTGIHLSAYVMWRLNWIHPFADGNGRTSRILSYMVLCGKLGLLLPGTQTIPEQIAKNKQPYYSALEAADVAFKKGKVDVSDMEKLLESYLANQLIDVHAQATGTSAVQSSATETPKPLKRIIGLVESYPVLSGGVFLLVATIVGLIFT